LFLLHEYFVSFRTRGMRAFVSGEKLRKRNGHDMNGECPRQITPVSPLDHRLYATLARGQLHSLLPVQKQTLSRALAGSFERDLCVTAPTGSGKTLSYLLPVLQILSKRVSKAETVCLILVPSGDLSAQVCVAASELCKALHVQISIVGKSRNTTNSTNLVNKRYRRLLAQNRQRMYQCCITRQFARHNSLDVPSQILVASPGRFAAHRTSILKKLKLLVIDEADRMLQQSYQNWLVTLDYEMCARTRQCRRLTVGERNSERLQLIFCSATLQSSCLQRVGAFALIESMLMIVSVHFCLLRCLSMRLLRNTLISLMLLSRYLNFSRVKKLLSSLPRYIVLDIYYSG